MSNFKEKAALAILRWADRASPDSREDGPKIIRMGPNGILFWVKSMNRPTNRPSYSLVDLRQVENVFVRHEPASGDRSEKFFLCIGSPPVTVHSGSQAEVEALEKKIVGYMRGQCGNGLLAPGVLKGVAASVVALVAFSIFVGPKSAGTAEATVPASSLGQADREKLASMIQQAAQAQRPEIVSRLEAERAMAAGLVPAAAAAASAPTALPMVTSLGMQSIATEASMIHLANPTGSGRIFYVFSDPLCPACRATARLYS